MNPEYLLDIAYTKHFYENLNPWLINYISAINGYTAPNIKDKFTYCELGCGNGISLNILAAANPQGLFYGVDFNPEHIANARLATKEGGLDNVTLLEEDFANLPNLELPDFDFITLHGVFSWVSPAMRNRIVTFIARKLMHGGMVMVSYNTPQGWAVVAPMRDFLRSFIADGSGADLIEKARRGLEELCFLRDAKSAYFEMNPLAGIVLDSYLRFDLRYIVHEFLTPHWQPLNFSEVLGNMKSAGIDYTGSYPVALNYGQMSIPETLHGYFQQIKDRTVFEMRKDLVRMTLFRSDIFCRETSQEKPSYLDKFRGMVVGTALRKQDFKFHIEIPGHTSIDMQGPLFEKLTELMGGNSISMEALLAAPDLRPYSPEEITSAIEWFISTDQVKPYAQPAPVYEENDAFRMSHFNCALLQRELPQSRNIALASWTAGSGIPVTSRDGLALLALSEAGDREKAEEWAGLWTVRNRLVGNDEGNAPPLATVIKNAAANPSYLNALGLGEPPTKIKRDIT
ncbi:MAG: class I SAM-dependent methyltransferase [Syntrophus sp. (in: bacteria)]